MSTIYNSIESRAYSEHEGSALMNKKDNGKYSLFLPVTNLGELGSAPEQIEKTAVGNMAKSYIQGRKDNPQQSITIYTSRDYERILEKYAGKSIDFLRVFPDMSGVKYSGRVDYSFNDTAVGANAEQMTLSITITVPMKVVDDCFDLIEDTAISESDIPGAIVISKGETEKFGVITNPGDAKVEAKSETEGVATATYLDGVVTITGATAGSCIIETTVSKTGYASWKYTTHVIVVDNATE